MQTLAARTIENPFIKDRATFLELASETNGKYTSVLVEVGPKGGNGLHYHKTFDEIFTVREGQLGVQLGKDTFILEPGDTVRVKAGDLHSFFNPSETDFCSFVVVFEPGSRGMEIGLQVVYGLANDGRTNKDSVPKNLYHMALLVHWTDTNAPGFFTIIAPLLRWLCKRAIRKGIDKELIRQYVKY